MIGKIVTKSTLVKQTIRDRSRLIVLASPRREVTGARWTHPRSVQRSSFISFRLFFPVSGTVAPLTSCLTTTAQPRCTEPTWSADSARQSVFPAFRVSSWSLLTSGVRGLVASWPRCQPTAKSARIMRCSSPMNRHEWSLTT